MLGVLGVMVVVAAGCSADGGTRDGTAPLGTASAAPIHCDALAGAIDTLDYHLELMLELDSDGQYDAFRDSEAPVKLEPGLFRQAVAVLALVSGVEGDIDRLRGLAELLERNFDTPNPFSDGSGDGERLLGLADDVRGDAAERAHEALASSGCAGDQ
ncbi:hypothetical protein BH20CHL6_BH20CHL6_06420 [soil metagenome]